MNAQQSTSALKKMLGIGSPQKSTLGDSPQQRRRPQQQTTISPRWKSQSAPSSPQISPRVQRVSQHNSDNWNLRRATNHNRSPSSSISSPHKQARKTARKSSPYKSPYKSSHKSSSQKLFYKSSDQGTTSTSTPTPPKFDVLGPTCSLHLVLANADGSVHRGSKHVHENQLRKVFERYGNVYDITTGRTFHFVNFSSVADADKAYNALNGRNGQDLLDGGEAGFIIVKETCIRLQWALPRDYHPLFERMQEIQERRRSRLTQTQTTSASTLTSLNNSNVVDDCFASSATTVGLRSGVRRRPSSLQRFTVEPNVVLSASTVRNRSASVGKRWADVADDMSDDGDEGNDETEEKPESVSEVIKYDTSFDRFLSSWSLGGTNENDGEGYLSYNSARVKVNK